jgi:hypothetical protein
VKLLLIFLHLSTLQCALSFCLSILFMNNFINSYSPSSSCHFSIFHSTCFDMWVTKQWRVDVKKEGAPSGIIAWVRMSVMCCDRRIRR